MNAQTATPATLLRKAAADYADRVAVICGDDSLTYSEFAERANRVANALADAGLTRGDRVAMLGDNCLESLEQIIGLGISGFVRCSLHAHDTPPRHRYLMELTGARVLLVQDKYYGQLTAELDAMSTVDLVVVLGEPPAARDSRVPTVGYEEWLATASPAPPSVVLDSSDPDVIKFSAGTTGFPKGVVMSVAATIAMGDELGLVLPSFAEYDRYLAAGPLTHAASMFIYPLLDAGAATVVLPRFDPATFLDVVERERITSTLIVPTMIQMIVDQPGAGTRDLCSLRAVMYGAAPIAEPTLVKAIQLWGNIMYQLYGQSEAVPISVLTPRDHSVNGTEADQRKLSSAGRPTPNATIRIVGDDDMELPSGEVGEVVAWSPCMMSGIWGDDAAAAARVTPDGWVRTRDMGYLCDEGFLHLVDRKEDMIISGGFNIWPAELESAIATHPAVREVAVVGAAHSKWGETPVAVVVPREDSTVTQDEIVAWSREKVGSHKKVTQVFFTDELPRTPLGKLLRKRVRDKYSGGTQGIRGA